MHTLNLLMAAGVGAVFMYAVCWVRAGREARLLQKVENDHAKARAALAAEREQREYLSKEVHRLQWELAREKDAPRLLSELDARFHAMGAHECASCRTWTKVGPVCSACVDAAIEFRDLDGDWDYGPCDDCGREMVHLGCGAQVCGPCATGPVDELPEPMHPF